MPPRDAINGGRPVERRRCLYERDDDSLSLVSCVPFVPDVHRLQTPSVN